MKKIINQIIMNKFKVLMKHKNYYILYDVNKYKYSMINILYST